MRSVLATKTRQALTENNIKCTKHIRARRNSSEGLLNDMCEISAVTKRSEKEAAFEVTTLVAEPSFSGSASDSGMF